MSLRVLTSIGVVLRCSGVSLRVLAGPLLAGSATDGIVDRPSVVRAITCRTILV